MRVCRICELEKTLDDFRTKDNGSGHINYETCCYECESTKQKMSKYKLSKDEVYSLTRITNCEICNKEVSGRDQCIDHDHDTGRVRGILCRTCNKMLGLSYDNTNILLNAVKYLTR